MKALCPMKNGIYVQGNHYYWWNWTMLQPKCNGSVLFPWADTHETSCTYLWCMSSSINWFTKIRELFLVLYTEEVFLFFLNGQKECHVLSDGAHLNPILITDCDLILFTFFSCMWISPVKSCPLISASMVNFRKHNGDSRDTMGIRIQGHPVAHFTFQQEQISLWSVFCYVGTTWVLKYWFQIFFPVYSFYFIFFNCWLPYLKRDMRELDEIKYFKWRISHILKTP